MSTYTGRRAYITRHAIRRYVERVKPCLGRAAAATELETLLSQATVAAEPPAWITRPDPERHYVEISDGIVVVLSRRGEAMTVLTRCGYGDELRALKNEQKKKKKKKKKKKTLVTRCDFGDELRARKKEQKKRMRKSTARRLRFTNR